MQKRGFIAEKELKRLLPDFGNYSEYGNSRIDIVFYHPQKYFSESVVQGACVIALRNRPLPIDNVQAEAGAIELKRSYQSDAMSVQQAKAECCSATSRYH